MKLQIDRFEEALVVCVDEEERVYHIPRGAFTFEPHEGDLFEVIKDGDDYFDMRFLAEETAEARERTRRLMERLKNKKK